jgi:hypothetical protein
MRSFFAAYRRAVKSLDRGRIYSVEQPCMTTLSLSQQEITQLLRDWSG